MKILILAAIPQEHGFFRRMTGPWRRICRKPFTLREMQRDDRTVSLVESGMGAPAARRALDWGLTRTAPDLLMSVGFGGSITGEFEVGDVALGDRFDAEPALDAAAPGRALALTIGEQWRKFAGSKGIRPARFLTVAGPRPKLELRSLYGDVPSLIDMETLFAARAAHERGIPFLSLRAVSDGPEDEIGFDLADITDSDGRISLGGVLRLIASNPRVIGAFYRSWRRSLKAGRRLGECLAEVVSLPAVDLDRIVRECTIEERSHQPVPGN